MSMALLLLREILVLFLIMGLGFLVVKLGLMNAGDSRVLSLLQVYIIYPCIMIKSFQLTLSPEILQGFLFAVAVAIVANFLLLIFSKLMAKLFGLDAVEQASIMYANTANMIFPLVMAVLGDEWLIYSSAFMCVQVIFVWTHGNALLSGQKGISWRKIFTNINLMAVAVGLGLMLLGIRLPEILVSVFDDLASTAGPLAMVMIGMLLANVKWKEVLTNKRIYLVTFLKMIAVPLLILTLMKLSGVAGLIENGRNLLYISFMAVISPCAATLTQIAQLYRNRPEHASAINVVTTLASLVTMPLMTWLYMSWI